MFKKLALSPIICALLLAAVVAPLTPASQTHAATIPSGAIVVDAKGTGNYKTVQAAIDSIPANNSSNKIIYIKNGTYKEKLTVPTNKPNISFMGESQSGTILTYDDYANKVKSDGTTLGTSGSPSMFIYSNNVTAETLTIQNTAAPRSTVGQAVALYISGDRVALKSVSLLGHQDTLYVKSGRQYFKDSYIEGDVDFIFGGGTAVFENCQIQSNGDGYVTAAATPQSSANGFVFINSRLTKASGVSTGKTYLGRPWRPQGNEYPNVKYVNTSMDAHINSAGWANWNSTSDNYQYAIYAEYKSTGAGASPSTRVSWSKQLTDTEASKLTAKLILAGSDNWNPTQ